MSPVLKGFSILIVAVELFASIGAAQDKPFFSAQYPAAGVPLSAATPSLQGVAPKVRNPRVVSSDDLKSEAQVQTQAPRAPNLTQYGVDFDRRHPELFAPQPDPETVKQQLNQGQGSPTPTPSPSPSPTPWRIKVGRRVFVVNPNANLQPGANPTPTPVIIVVQPPK
jgi:hypothetical protein